MSSLACLTVLTFPRAAAYLLGRNQVTRLRESQVLLWGGRPGLHDGFCLGFDDPSLRFTPSWLISPWDLVFFS